MRFRYLLGYLSFWVSSMESPLIFLYKKIRKTKYIQIHDWILLFIDWIKEITYLENFLNYIVLGPSYNLQKIHGFCPSYVLPKKNKDKAKST